MPTLRLHPSRDGPLRCLKAVACKANRVYYPLVFLVGEPIDGFIAKRTFLANPRTAAHCFSGPCARERALPSMSGSRPATRRRRAT